ncbi:MAG: Tetraacyldisaccharide 4-kinase [Proteobacteria bacterium]|nr:Tetraacyldisaccharide 4-kinase [Pseudomonadota bacterium]
MTIVAKLSAWVQGQWYDRSTPNVLLRPLSAIYSGVVAVRRRAYASGLKPVTRLPVPVIVVGNLTVGGTGKTPLVIAVTEMLVRAGYRPGIVSRGYGGRRLAEPMAVGVDSDPREAGDEPLLVARHTGRPVMVFPARVEAARRLLETTDCDVIVADDGLQHYALGRDIEIAVVDGARRFGNGACLPAGPLREPIRRLSCVDMVVCQGGTPEPGEFAMRLEGDEAVNLQDESRRKPLAEFAAVSCRALAGIGNPGRFFAHLEAAGLKIEARAFPDHHPFTREDVWSGSNMPVLMTEKDAVKCRFFAEPQHWYVPVTARLPATFENELLTRLKAKRDGQKTA